jgi:hypothetical protein
LIRDVTNCMISRDCVQISIYASQYMLYAYIVYARVCGLKQSTLFNMSCSCVSSYVNVNYSWKVI